MKWMEPFLESGQLAGKIICPNMKCGAKLGNYDWAGVCCGCKEWVTPVRIVKPIIMLPKAHPCFLGILHQSIEGGRSRVNYF
jgi:hypothetical protein